MIAGIDLRAARKAKKLTQTDAGKLIGVNRNTIHSYESGESKPSIQVITDLCSAYGFNICLLTEQEYAILQGIEPFLAKNGAK